MPGGIVPYGIAGARLIWGRDGSMLRQEATHPKAPVGAHGEARAFSDPVDTVEPVGKCSSSLFCRASLSDG